MQVEVANVKRGELGAGAREEAVENELGKFKGCCRFADVARKVDAFSPHYAVMSLHYPLLLRSTPCKTLCGKDMYIQHSLT